MVAVPTPGSNPQTYTYRLFYSGSDEGASTYAIGWASCRGPSGPCTDESTSDATAHHVARRVGARRPRRLHGRQSATVMAFAGWQGTTIGYLACGIRPMYLADLTFQPNGGVPATPTLTPAVPAASPAASPACPLPPQPDPGYWQVGSDGGIFSFGGAQFYGSTGSMHLNKPVVGMAATPDGNGYWLVASDGGVFAYGDAQFYGSTGSITLNKPIVGLIPTLDGGGYWLIASDGGVFAFGDATVLRLHGGDNLGYPITAAATSFLGGGYWLVDANGQVFNFGDAPNEGQPTYAPGGYRITGMAGTQSSNGYWLASANGNVADFGDAAPYGSMVGTTLNAPVVGMAANGRHGLLAARGRRRHLHLRPRRVLRLHGRAVTSTRPWSASPRPDAPRTRPLRSGVGRSWSWSAVRWVGSSAVRSAASSPESSAATSAVSSPA